MSKNVGIFSSTRADYAYLRPVAFALRKRGIEVHFFVAGMHLQQKYGNTSTLLTKDGFTTTPIPSSRKKNEAHHQAHLDGSILQALPSLLTSHAIEVLLVLGDRSESLAASLCATHAGSLIAHIHGGDVSYGGGIDDSIRHAITKLAHIHFPATHDSARRLKRLQEEPWRIEMVGETSIENISRKISHAPCSFIPPEVTCYAVLLQHGETQRAHLAGKQIRAVLTSLQKQRIYPVVIASNDDPGSKDISAEIKHQSESSPLTLLKNLDTTDFFDLVQKSLFLIGNSSAGIIEMPHLGVASINLGIRQQGRKCYVSTLHGEFRATDIDACIKEAQTPLHRRKTKAVAQRLHTGLSASERIAKSIAKLSKEMRLFQKIMS